MQSINHLVVHGDNCKNLSTDLSVPEPVFNKRNYVSSIKIFMLASIPWIESAQHNVVCNPIIDTYNAM